MQELLDTQGLTDTPRELKTLTDIALNTLDKLRE